MSRGRFVGGRIVNVPPVMTGSATKFLITQFTKFPMVTEFPMATKFPSYLIPNYKVPK
jgi:hypothetical protein